MNHADRKLPTPNVSNRERRSPKEEAAMTTRPYGIGMWLLMQDMLTVYGPSYTRGKVLLCQAPERRMLRQLGQVASHGRGQLLKPSAKEMSIAECEKLWSTAKIAGYTGK